MRIEPFDAVTADEATALSYAELVADATAGSTPAGLRRPPELTLNLLRNEPADRRTFGWLAYDGELMAAAGEIEWTEAPDNRDRCWAHFLLPGGYDERLVSALAAAMAAESLRHDRPVLNVEVPAGPGVRDWVAARGGRFGSREEHNVTRLAALSRDDLAAIVAARPAGYELLTVDDVVPDDLVDGFLRLCETMNDAPRDDLTMEDWIPTTDQLRAWERALAARGHLLWQAFARETATGELAAFNQLVVRPDWPECIENEDTAVAVRHRGHGLGLWVKAANLLRVKDERPEAVCVETWNAASNDHMLRVNRRLGFVCEHVWESWELDATAAL